MTAHRTASKSSARSAANRHNHTDLPKAEILASAARMATDYQYPHEYIRQAYEDVLWHDEHTWGHHFPAGPGARASSYEKSVHAFRPEALAHDVKNKAMAIIADFIKAPDNPAAVRLVVFNTPRPVNVCEEPISQDKEKNVAEEERSARIKVGPKSIATILITDSGLQPA